MILPQVASLIERYKAACDDYQEKKPNSLALSYKIQDEKELKGWLSALEEVLCHLQNESRIDRLYFNDVEETIAAIKGALGQ